MRAIIRGLANDNGSLRGLTGQGEPGLWTLLGGAGAEEDSDSLSLSGGAGQVSATSRVARSNGEVRLAAVASGTTPDRAPRPTPVTEPRPNL